MNSFFAVLIIFFTSAASAAMSPHLSVFGITPELLFIEMIIFSLTEEYRRFLIYNFLASLFYSFLSGLPLLAAILPFFISISASNILFRRCFGGFHFFSIIAYVALSFAAFKTLEIFFLLIQNYPLSAILFHFEILKIIIAQIIYNTVLTALAILFLKKAKIINRDL